MEYKSVKIARGARRKVSNLPTQMDRSAKPHVISGFHFLAGMGRISNAHYYSALN